ncbi:HAMP domain-containing sensor histidine kinase [Pediococcus acidilactici]|uniref:sensor histidine kinase n=1 Tax=Pediococcus acidilactici TaxID=1254 RepID=UPI000326FF37|nr:HAMP domain-containing sensor histidine kinase [Pediococcus acidilactici]EOA08932.1 phosphate regulon sensor kinase PhoR, phoR [Pediococcus acidilactici D3]MBW4797194.1 HAMP domain-containing histidine kinase [Pediococcus acidilactici]MBW9306844.1 HAMP domain-containing histidine kinase [Pediococcus acidilactici]MCE5962313.1 HAMP domain-containing histidine kinase [Pediococcus acidilactici]MCW8083316.1 HAMP domain-containing histidine kinase [Pediococcus acidilactici]
MKLFFQQMMAFLAVTVATLLIVGLVFIQFTRDSVYRTKWHSLQEYADSIFQQLVVLDPQDSSVTTVRVDQLMGMERLLNNQHIHFTIYTENGERVSYPNDNTATQISKKQWRELNKGNILRQESRMAVGQVKHRITMTELKKPYFDRQGKLICVIAVGSPLANVQADIQQVQKNLLVTFGLAILVAIVASYFLSRYMVRRIQKIRQAAHRVTEGDFEVQLDPGRQDEIGELSADFNLMTKSLKESNDEIKRQEERRRAFMADAAHEMRTPLTTINGLLEGLEYDAIPEDSKEESIRLMQRETKRLIRLVNDNLDYERIRTNKIKLDCQMVNLKQAVLRVVEQLGKKAEKENDQLIVEMNSDVVVYADPDRLIQILFNIVQNGIQFTQNGQITVRAQNASNGTNIQISDNGIGMTEDQIKNIWERYYKADASRIQTKGESGLGMAIVHELVQIHGGEIEVSSAPGRGTTFKLHFPKAPADQ